jgi:hypothetical protein
VLNIFAILFDKNEMKVEALSVISKTIPLGIILLIEALIKLTNSLVFPLLITK